MINPLFSAQCDEPEGNIIRSVYLFDYSPDNVMKLYNQAKKFPTIFSREFTTPDEFIAMFMYRNTSGVIEPCGVLHIIDDFVGTFYLDRIDHHTNEADVHYCFFDGRFRGRIPLIDKACNYAFDVYGLERLNVSIPAYVPLMTRHHVTLCGFTEEGKKRSAIPYKGKRFDLYTYGRLKGEIANV